MQDRELYQEILGLKSPWAVTNVALNLKEQQVDVFVGHPCGTKFCYPECSLSLPCYDHTPERQWRHPDGCQFRTLLHASVPRVDCPEHGVRQVSVPWAEKGSRFTILFDLHNSTVEAISDGNDTDSGIACLSQLSDAQIQSVEAIAMDMSASCVKAAKQVIPLAENRIVHDRFHVMQLMKNGDDSLSKTTYVWQTSFENLSEKQQALFDAVYDLQLQTGKAWAFMEMLRDLWSQTSAASATTCFNDWYRRVIQTKPEPMKAVARSIRERLRNVVSYCTDRITNFVAAGMNSRIMFIKRRVGGFRNRQNFKTAIFFYCGGLSLYPH